MSSTGHRMPRDVHTGSQESSRGQEQQAMQWAALLAGRIEPLPDIPATERYLATWWSDSFETDCAALSAKLHTQPDPFLTTRFAQEVRFFQKHFALIRPLIARFLTRESSVIETMTQIMRLFNAEEEGLLAWRRSIENLSSLVRWTPAFLHAREYLCCSLPLGRPNLDDTRRSLLDMLESPHKFLEGPERDSFDGRFLEFKKCYVEAYSSAHEDALRIIGDHESKVDATALRNLEILSTLRHADKSFLRRVRVIGYWIRRNQCGLPVRQILERHPRCYCNFHPIKSQQPIDSATQINSTIREGLECFRASLRKCKHQIIDELRSLDVDNLTAKQIASLLSRGPLAALKPQAVEVLNRVSEKYSAEFLCAMRGTSRRSKSASAS